MASHSPFPPTSPPPQAGQSSPLLSAQDSGRTRLLQEADSSTRFIVERRTMGLIWNERLGCFLATGVCVIPLILFCSAMLPLLQQENGLTLLMLSMATALGACVALLGGLAISVFAWWIPRMIYLALHPHVRRKDVRAGVRSRGIWISGIGWIAWTGLHVREKTQKLNSVGPCSAIVVMSPEQGDIILKSAECAPELLKQIRYYIDDQETEFQPALPTSESIQPSAKGRPFKDTTQTTYTPRN